MIQKTIKNLLKMRHAIRFRLLGTIFLLLGTSIGVSMFGIWSFQRDRYLEKAHREANNAGRAIEKSQRTGMFSNNWEGIQTAINEIHQVVKPSEISILGYDGRVAVSSDPVMIGRKFDRQHDLGCIQCHGKDTAAPQLTDIFLETPAGTVLRNVITIVNAPECYGCHDSSQKNLGIVIYDSPFADTYAMLKTMLIRFALTSLATFILIIIILSWVIQRFVHQPLYQLMDGFVHVGKGDFKHWVEIESEGEFLEMADQFNVMTRAIDRSFSEIKKKNWETGTLYSFVQQLGRAIEWNRLQRIVINLLLDTLKLEYALLLLHQEKSKCQGKFDASSRQVGDNRFHHKVYGPMCETGDLPTEALAVWIDWQKEPFTEPRFDAGNTLAFLPLATKNIAIGLICIRRPANSPFDESEKKLVRAVGEQVGIALANARLYRMAITDTLTGLYTRRYCDAAMQKLLDKHNADSSQGFCVLMLDLDHFKLVNDTHGHQVGDEVLIQLAELIKSHLRFDDVACRFGGEEFIVLIFGGPEVGVETGNRIRLAIEEHVFACETINIHNTVSIGLAHFPSHGQTGNEVIGAADQALYAAKAQGRNRLVLFTRGN